MRKFMKKFSAIFISALLVVMTCITGLTAFAANGSGTISVKDSKVGEKYEFYKVLDLTWREAGTAGDRSDDVYNYTLVRTGGTDGKGYSAFFAGTNDAGQTRIANFNTMTALQQDKAVYQYLSQFANDSAELHQFATDIKQFATANGLSANYFVDGNDGTATKTGVEYGYYVMVPSDVSTGTAGDTTEKIVDTVAIFSVDTVTPTVQIQNKSDYPHIYKAVKTGSGNYQDAVSAAIGDTVTFKIGTLDVDHKLTVPNMTGYEVYKLTVHDTLSAGLTLASGFNESNVTITVGGQAYTNTDAQTQDKYTVTVTGDDAHEITINFVNPLVNLKDHVGEDIVITYDATVNSDAVIGTLGNPNDVYLEFSNNPAATTETDTDRTPTEEVKVYVASYEFTKVDSNGSPIDGATFTFESNGNANNIANVKITNTDGTKAYDATTKKWTFTTGASGRFLIEGLKEGTYTLTETAAPDGYQMLEQPITITISCNDETLTVEKLDNTQCTFDCDATSTQSGVVDSVTHKTDGKLAFNVINQTQGILPKTGAATLIGIGVVGGAGLAATMILRKKDEKDEELEED